MEGMVSQRPDVSLARLLACPAGAVGGGSRIPPDTSSLRRGVTRRRIWTNRAPGRRSMNETFQSSLHELVERWVRANNTTYERLLRSAGLAVSVGTDIRRGS